MSGARCLVAMYGVFSDCGSSGIYFFLRIDFYGRCELRELHLFSFRSVIVSSVLIFRMYNFVFSNGIFVSCLCRAIMITCYRAYAIRVCPLTRFMFVVRNVFTSFGFCANDEILCMSAFVSIACGIEYNCLASCCRVLFCDGETFIDFVRYFRINSNDVGRALRVRGLLLDEIVMLIYRGQLPFFT